MTTIRFVHTDHLRLGAPLSGVAHPPSWLQQLTSSSVRQAVRNVIDTAIAERAHFLFIAGSICDSSEDLESASRWLSEQFVALRREGIRVVAVADNHTNAQHLHSICDVVLSRSECLLVTGNRDGDVQFVKSAAATVGQSSDLVITSGRPHELSQIGRTAYHAVPALRADAGSDRMSGSASITVSAGAVQSLHNRETWNCGCVVVSADIAARQLATRFVVCNPIRFASETLDLTESVTAARLVDDMAAASRSLQRTTEQTVIVDWTVQSRLTSDHHELLQMDEPSLLSHLRHQLESGHQGVWPRRIHLAEPANVLLEHGAGAAEEEYVDVVTGPDSERRLSVSQQAAGAGRCAELIAGLQLLSRVA